MKKKITILVSFILTLALFQLSAFEVVNLSCEKSDSPIAISTTSPRLGWQITSNKNGTRQTAYMIEMFEVINGKEKVVWKSGKIKSDQSQNIKYSGSKELEPLKKYTWRVKVWNEKNKSSKWSSKSFFRVAPDISFFDSSWIGHISREDARLPKGRNFHSTVLKKPENRELWGNVNPISNKSIYLRQEFNADKKISEAIAYISGLGLYELSINGKKVGDSEFAPLLSDYDKSVYYNTYDVTEYLSRGDNAIGVLLGNGFYNVQGGRYRKLLISFGPPTLNFKMVVRYTDGTSEEIISDNSWRYSFSPIIFNCIYGGEDYDATLEQTGWDSAGFDDSKWSPVIVQTAPEGKLRPQETTPVKIMERYSIQETNKLSENSYVLDMGQNLAGFPEIVVNGRRGDTIRLTVGESLNADGSVSQKQTGSKHYYEYILKGEGDEYWHPRFSYYGFRFIQVDGAKMEGEASTGSPVIKDIKSCFIYNSADHISTFHSSNSIFNNAHRIIGKAVRSNMQSVFTDCPHREKLGWLEQVHLNGPGLYYNYDLRTFIPKLLQDISDSQLDNGLVPSITPEYVVFDGAFRDSPEWGSTSVIQPWMYYLYYGDDSMMRNHYSTMKRYVDYLTSTATDHIVSHGLGDWYDYDGKKAGYSRNTPIPLVATAHYYYDLLLMSKMAAILGNEKDEADYFTLSEEVKAAYIKEFFNEDTKQFGSASQASNAIPLFFDLVEPQYRDEVLQNLVADIKKHGNRLTTGDVGNRYLFQTLANNDLNELMYLMNNHEDAPGYGFQVKFGATTLTEQWDPREGTSWNHFMMGQIDEWFFASLAGIKPDPDRPGFKEFIIEPQVVGDMNFVSASTKTLYGKISVDWKREGAQFILNISVPANSSAKVILPNKEIHNVESGKYTFTINI